MERFGKIPMISIAQKKKIEYILLKNNLSPKTNYEKFNLGRNNRVYKILAQKKKSNFKNL